MEFVFVNEVAIKWKWIDVNEIRAEEWIKFDIKFKT